MGRRRSSALPGTSTPFHVRHEDDRADRRPQPGTPPRSTTACSTSRFRRGSADTPRRRSPCGHWTSRRTRPPDRPATGRAPGGCSPTRGGAARTRRGRGADLLQPDAPGRRRGRRQRSTSVARDHRRDRRPGPGPGLVAGGRTRCALGDGGGLLRRSARRRRARVHVPGPADRTLVDRVIFDELTQGTGHELAGGVRRRDRAAGGGRSGGGRAGLHRDRAAGRAGRSPLPLLDSMRVHAEAAVDFALADRTSAASSPSSPASPRGSGVLT